ncbi:MAG: 4Fe-4S dicluster domain-containing protein [Lachnospiraceae bacterium]|nr:4Fe-4S dicluster domain-containing protein [Lachnospiraceae bacterium]
MDLNELKKTAREYGIVGAGGAGFPSYAKMTDQADTVLLNCVECEPLLKLHRQLLAAHPAEIIGMLETVRESFGAKEAVIGIKSEYKETIEAIRPVVQDYPSIRIEEVTPAYPMGDEVVLIYEATGRIVRPGGLPLEQGAVVYNVETMYNLYRAVHENHPVTDKLVSIVGEIDHPATLRIPLGMAAEEAVALAGKPTVKDPVYLFGGPMMGRTGSPKTPVTKTTNAIILLSGEHPLIRKSEKNLEVERRRASSSCCQCRTCTDLCSRHLLGHPIEPHRIMRAIANSDLSDLSVFVNAAYCSGCGICEKYACPQGLSPKSIIQEFKAGLRKGGIKLEPYTKESKAAADREYKKVPVHRLAERLGLKPYDREAPLSDHTAPAAEVRIPLSQHIGAPAKPVVGKGEKVSTAQVIGEAAEGLSVAIHSSIDGTVKAVSEKEIIIQRG